MVLGLAVEPVLGIEWAAAVPSASRALASPEADSGGAAADASAANTARSSRSTAAQDAQRDRCSSIRSCADIERPVAYSGSESRTARQVIMASPSFRPSLYSPRP